MKIFRKTARAKSGGGRKGSALLIVLGFLSFMVVSAVSFAVYMRTERLSSSGYRYSVSARHFCRAALARALYDIENYSGNEFPDIGHENHWRGRVLVPEYVEAFESTLSSLTLEGLGYLPPALVNDVRYWSRHTSTARWNKLDFDVARCVYSIVNVSDLFDANKVRPCARTSNPTNRVSTAYQWMNQEGTKFETASHPEKFGKEFLDERGSNYKEVPFVSLMDYNVSLAAKKDSAWSSYGMVSPFYEYLKAGQNSSKGNTRFFYDGKSGGAKEDVQTFAAANRGWYVTDSWNTNTWPRTGGDGGSRYYANLAYPEGQPFVEGAFKKGGQVNILEILNEKQQKTPWYLGEIGTSGIKFDYEIAALLFDYLDQDSIPYSLALPCTERAPMVAAVKLQTEDGGVRVEPKTKSQENDSEKIEEYSFTISNPFRSVEGWAVLPFKRVSEFKEKKWDAEVFVRIWVGRTDNSNQRNEYRTRFPTGDPERWQSGGRDRVNETFEKSSWTFRYTDDTHVAVPSSIKEEKDAFMQFTCRPAGTGNTLEIPFLRKTTKKENGKETETVYECLLAGDDGKPLVDGTKTRANMIDELGKLRFKVAAWVALKSESGKYCDLVPACCEDDKNYNDRNISDRDSRYISFGSDCGYPTLYFPQSGSLDGTSLVSAPQQFAFHLEWSGLQVADPRYNFAPENWCRFDGAIDSFTSGSDGVPSLWNEYLGKDGRDSDIFMAVSDATNLQSIAEFAMLPRYDAESAGASRYGSSKNVNFADAKEAPDFDCFWRTFGLFKQQEKYFDDLYSMNVVNMFQGAQRINPYSDLAPIRMALVQNTPFDWWSAGASYLQDNSNPSLEDTMKYTFCPRNGYGTDAYLTMRDQTNIANRIFGQIREQPRDSRNWNWQSAFDGLGWGGDNPRTFLGLTLDNESTDLHGVDKKFLYGFWRDCLGADQQLFLVFVRCEPAVIGSDTPGQTPAQLGVRAVALVWRNPRPPRNAAGSDGPPHQTRILFYHQFE